MYVCVCISLIKEKKRKESSSKSQSWTNEIIFSTGQLAKRGLWS